MVLALPFPNVSPEIFSVEILGLTLALRWYAMAYIAGILIAWWMAARAMRQTRLWAGPPPATPEQIGDFISWVIVGIIVGGRLGFVIFYEPAYYFANPLEILAIWQGGMAFHGGFLGVAGAGLLYCKSQGISLLKMADVMAFATPPALALGRLANFINAELWGRPSDAPWAVIFPGALAQDCPGPVGVVEGLCARHPSQLYEALLEGVLLGIVLLWLVYRRAAFKRGGLVLGVFLAGYGAGRFIVEFYRQADPQFITPENPMGWVLSLGPLGVSMGQLLSLPMLFLGLGFILWSLRRGASRAATGEP
ncbi:MAG: prolipoprotein diacylglyceryl transferase [Pseudomonadota bacterium]